MEWYRFLGLVGLIFFIFGILLIYILKKQLKKEQTIPDDVKNNREKRLLLANVFGLLGVILSIVSTMVSDL